MSDLITKSFCNECVGERNHAILHVEKQSGTEELNEHYRANWSKKHEMLKCLGCDTISLSRTMWHSENTGGDGRPEPIVDRFPPATFRRQPAWLSELWLQFCFDDDDKRFISELVHEIYVCLQNDCRRSAAMAVRALLEQVMIDKVGDQGAFTRNVREFESKGFISASQREFLETVVEAGHATIHRAFKPSKEDLVAILNIAESVIESAYINEFRAAELKKRIPPKKP